MRLETLYTLDSKGKVRVFECEVQYGMYDPYDQEYKSSGHDYPSIVTWTGLLGGKLIEKRELVKVGKQKRSITEQAQFQCQSLWNEKLDEGYKSEEVLIKEQNRRGFDVANIIPEAHNNRIQSLLHLIPEASYTNSNWDELPMLAHKFKDIKKPEFPYYAQPKLNGVRCLVKKKGNEILLCSRGGTYYKVPHLIAALEQLWFQFQDANIILDGEIYKHGIPLQDISGAARREETGMFTSNNWLEYHIYDVISLDTLTSNQNSRMLGLDMLRLNLDNNPILKVLPTNRVKSNEEVKELHDKFVSEGYEGLILRFSEGKYEFNTRSKNLLKVKQYQDAEFIIIDCGYDDNKATIGESFYFVLRNDINNLTFKARPTGTIAMKENWFKDRNSWTNRKATVRYFERSTDGLPLQACVRHKDTEVLIEHLRPNDE